MLLDTHVALWLLDDSPRLGARARELMQSEAGKPLVSTAALWEIAIKAQLGRIEVPDDLPERIEAAGLGWLPVAPAHAWRSRTVDLPHRDPFDRLLVAQAAMERATLVTADRVLLAAAPGDVPLLDARQ
ncbi:MAG: type II toxin-antitoxin system VapC family toxin [Nocardioides sp.]